MTIRERAAGPVRVLDVDGPITCGDGADSLRARVQSLVSQGHVHLVVNVEHVAYLDSSGLGELVLAHATLARHGGALKLVNATRRLRDLLVMTRLLAVLEQFDSEPAALDSFDALAVDRPA